MSHRVPPAAVLGGGAVVLLLSIGLALGLGNPAAGFGELLAALRGTLEGPARTIVLDVRLPRVLLGALVGAALASAGVAFQAVLRNPLADPFLLGVSGGALLGRVLWASLGASDPLDPGPGAPLAAFAGALGTLAVLFGLTRAGGRTRSVTLLLVGVVLNAFFSAVVLFLLTAADTARTRDLFFLLVGTLPSPSWAVLAMVATLVLLSVTALALGAHRLNLLSLGDETAAHLGVQVERATWATIGVASLATAAAVAFAGIIGFVGLVVPHGLRLALGPDHRRLVPGAALGGAAFLVLADAGARTLLQPVQLPVGVLTAGIGGPFFLVLLWRRLREAAG
ncbi:MAG TPA: iron ABC transporter permease [Candidatus Polarisedimenticolaceae bacterium]|nr:iron ABC transporter permease [Candidatus Polarisedimenticolaceae bacterium]